MIVQTVCAHQKAGKIAAGDTAAGEVEILDGALIDREQADVSRRGLRDGQPGDGVVLAVKAIEKCEERHETSAAVPGRGAAGINVIGQDGVLAARNGDKALQPINVRDLIGRRGAAVAARRAQECRR